MNDQVTDALKGAMQTSYARFFLGLLALGPFILLGLIWLANRVLPSADAEAFKAPLFTLWQSITAVSGLTTFAGGLLRTYGKVSTQKAIAVEAAKAVTQPDSLSPAVKPSSAPSPDFSDVDETGAILPDEDMPALRGVID